MQVNASMQVCKHMQVYVVYNIVLVYMCYHYNSVLRNFAQYLYLFKYPSHIWSHLKLISQSHQAYDWHNFCIFKTYSKNISGIFEEYILCDPQIYFSIAAQKYNPRTSSHAGLVFGKLALFLWTQKLCLASSERYGQILEVKIFLLN